MQFTEEPPKEPWGDIAISQDLWGNRWYIMRPKVSSIILNLRGYIVISNVAMLWGRNGLPSGIELYEGVQTVTLRK